MDTAQLRALFNKPYGAPGPSEAQWRQLYAEDVHFSDPTQERDGIEFVYPGTSLLLFNSEGKICDHRDYFDFVGPTFGPVPILGGFVRWLYRRFVG